jgi:hypothetical protein
LRIRRRESKRKAGLPTAHRFDLPGVEPAIYKPVMISRKKKAAVRVKRPKAAREIRWDHNAFERRLLKRVKLAATAGGAIHDEDPIRTAQESLELLQRNPSLRVLTEPDGPVFYEDPFLDSAWTCMQAARNANASPAAQGEDLNNRLDHWIPYIVPLVIGRLKRNRDVLENRTPTSEVEFKLPVRFAIFGDAGYRGLAQKCVLQMIERRHRENAFNALIHLGDTYHGGSEAEMLGHIVAPLSDLHNRLNVKVFSLCGNHDLYSGPDGYLELLTVFAQPGRYFAIEMASWRVACMDTALGDRSIRCMDGEIDEPQLNWLKEKQKDQKRLVVLTHHLPRSAWDKAPATVREQIQDIPKLVAWYWGHEHRCASYARLESANFNGGCVGNGAFLEKWSLPTAKLNEALVWYPKTGRCQCFGEGGQRYWPHGFMELELREDGAIERFFLEGSEKAVFERTLS